MATRKATGKRGKAAAEADDPKPSRRASVAVKSAAKDAKPKARPKPKPATKRAPRAAPTAEAEPAERPRPRPLSASDRERRFNLIVQTACLKAGTAAAISTITRKVPLLGKLAPVVLGSMAETVALGKIQQQLVREILELYELELTEPEERGVILLATAASIGAQQLSKRTVDELVSRLGGMLYRPVLARILPLASMGTEIAASVASTYAVGKRAQALCLLPGTGVRNLGELLRGLSGIDQTLLYKWSAEALGLAIKPFRGALSALIPGLR
jgi:uncharacterized protein (DUF697 family)